MNDKSKVYVNGVEFPYTPTFDAGQNDVDLDASSVTCRNENKQRIIPLGKMSLKALKEYITTARPNLIKEENEQALFVNINGKRLTRQGFWKII